MKVICIDATSTSKDQAAKRLLQEGIIYTATIAPDFDNAYDLYEIPIDPFDGASVCFSAWRFIPLSIVDEMEYMHNTQTIQQ